MLIVRPQISTLLLKSGSHTRLARLFGSRPSFQTLFSAETLRSSDSKFVIRSRTTDPFINLSIEDYILRHSDPQSHILFTYVNRPCVVIGRNQNPWLEVDLALLKHGVPAPTEDDRDARQEIHLIRRRSGGGTVFHDEGNLNYSFIVPNDKNFNRNKHAEVVVAALLGLSARIADTGQLLLPATLKKGIRVNERHDIVMPFRLQSNPALVDESRTVKVSGTAYKLIRGRALHHGTLLFSSPHLESIGSYLHSPARGFIEAKGIESVRSPIGNLRYSGDESLRDMMRTELENSIAARFDASYMTGSLSTSIVTKDSTKFFDQMTSLEEELRSSAWTYLQTPTFTFTCNPLPNTTFRPSPLPQHLPPSTRVMLEVRHGSITKSHISLSADSDIASAEAHQVGVVLQHKKLHEVGDWKYIFEGLGQWTDPSTRSLVQWLSEMFPNASK